MAGYSSPPLVKKLGMKPSDDTILVNQPDNYEQLIGLDLEKLSLISLSSSERAHFIHFFTLEMAELEVIFPKLKKQLKKDGMLWVSWPKATSSLPKDLNGNDVRSIGLGNGLVDVKVCAVDEDWSAIKFLYRRSDR
jgi:hypothetical protein